MHNDDKKNRTCICKFRLLTFLYFSLFIYTDRLINLVNKQD